MGFSMIPITKDEKMRLERAYPEYRYPRTMRGDSKRHHYYCPEIESLMRLIADTNEQAAAFVRECDMRRLRRRGGNGERGCR